MVLIGLMGAGKSTVAGALASRLRVRDVDTDAIVVERSGRSIDAIFAEDGEATFRALEAAAVAEALGSDAGVIATGGGAFMSPVVRAAIAAAGARTIYLRADVDALAARLADDDSDGRPLLAAGVRQTLESHFQTRDPVYRTADLVLETAGRSVEELVAEICDE